MFARQIHTNENEGNHLIINTKKVDLMVSCTQFPIDTVTVTSSESAGDCISLKKYTITLSLITPLKPTS